MKDFYDNIERCAIQACLLNKSNNKRCLVLFIHGLTHVKYDVDLGAGMKTSENMVINAKQHKKSKDNSGDIIAPIKFIEEFKKKLENKGLTVGIGDVFSAWNIQNGTQYLKNKGIDCYSIQMEINKNLRNDPKKTAELFCSVIKKLTDFSEPII